MKTDKSSFSKFDPDNDTDSLQSNGSASMSTEATLPNESDSVEKVSFSDGAPSDLHEYEVAGIHKYRSVSRSAVIAVVLTGLSFLAFTSPILIFLPLASLVLGLMARSAIKRYPDELVGAKPATIAIIGSIVIAVGCVGFHTYIRLTEVPDGYRRISWGELQPASNQSVAMVSPVAKELEGEQIFIKGYVYPNEEQTNLRAFILVRDKGTCCFGGTPKPTDMIYVKLEGDLRINYSWRQRKLGGIFSLDEVANRRVGKLDQIGLYRLTADHLQ